MQKYKKLKRLLSVSTAACLAIAGTGSFTGCGSGNGSTGSSQEDKESNSKDTGDSKAMGRYLEEELAVPEDCTEVASLQIMEDGSMEMLARNSDYELALYKSLDQGKTWGAGKSLTSLFCLDGVSFYKAALGKDGSILGGVFIESEDENSTGDMDYYYCPSGGEGKKLELGSDVSGSFSWDMAIGTNGNLFL